MARLPSRDEHIEFVGGPWAGGEADLPGLPDEIVTTDGRYVRSVRCAEDGAMRLVWSKRRDFRQPDGNLIGPWRDAPEADGSSA